LEVNVKKGKVTPKNVREYKVTVTIRPYSVDGEVYQHPEKGGEDHALAAIIPLEQVAALGLESGAMTVAKKLVYEMQRTGWPVKSEDEVIVDAGVEGRFTKRLVRGMGRTHRAVKGKK
jgi:hypothetical protein